MVRKNILTVALLIMLAGAVWADPRAEKLISLNFESIGISELIQVFKKETQLNIVQVDAIPGKVSVKFENAKPLEVLGRILASKGYGLNEKSGIYYVEKIAINSADLMKSFTVRYADMDKLQEQLLQIIPSLAGKMLINKTSNLLLIDAKHPDLIKAQSIIEKMDTVPKQVFVEAEILDMAVNDRDLYGFNATDGNSSMQTSEFNNTAPLNNSARGLFVKVLENSVNGYFQALKQSNANYDLLSSPRIMVLNNQEAVLSTQQKLGYAVDNIVNTSAGSSTVRTIQFLEVGTILKITPRVGDDGMVLMEVYPEVSDGEISSSGIPQKRVTNTNSKILVKDGQTFIIGGLIYDKVTKTKNAVPILSSLPLLGGLFQSEDTVKSKRDIVVMITPHIVDPQGQSKVTQIEPEREKHEEYRKALEVQK